MCNVSSFNVHLYDIYFFLFYHDKFIYPLINLSPLAIQILPVNKLLLLL